MSPENDFLPIQQSRQDKSISWQKRGTSKQVIAYTTFPVLSACICQPKPVCGSKALLIGHLLFSVTPEMEMEGWHSHKHVGNMTECDALHECIETALTAATWT